MFELIKEKTWHLLQGKEISLAMIYDKEGNILWHKGRDIRGKNTADGAGFCKSYIEESLKNPVRIDIEDFIESTPGNLSASAKEMLVKSIIIHPLHHGYFFYVDSGTKDIFSKEDRAAFKILGELLEQFITRTREESDIFGLSGTSDALEKIRDLVVKYSIEEEPVLLSGATGVGKNHIAGLIHRCSGRKGKFIIVDTPNIDQNLFESKLFGHKKGAFTDAKFDKTGLVEEAEKGTLFFDEVTEVPLEIQAKLLRFIDTRKYYTLGESTEKQADVRFIAATNKDLPEAVADKEFRRDLLYRLNVLEIKIPPLHERKEDIKNLVLDNRVLLRNKEIGDGFWDAVNDYRWPGNVRELLNVLKRAGIMLDSPITGKKLLSLIDVDARKGEQFIEDSGSPAGETREAILAGGNFWDIIWRPFIDRDLDRSAVKKILKEFYLENSSNFKKTIKSLNLREEDYQKFMSLLYKYKIDPRT